MIFLLFQFYSGILKPDCSGSSPKSWKQLPTSTCTQT